MASPTAPGPRWSAVTTALGVATLIGFVGLPVGFLLAYAFADEVTAGHHGFFLATVLTVAVLATLVAWPILAWALRYGAARGLAGALAVVGASYAAALGIGTTVSLLNEHQGSVTADQPDTPFLVLVTGCALVVVLGGAAASRVLRVKLPG